MPKSIHSFDRINIPAPCKADWDSMNLSAMTRPEAMRLLAAEYGTPEMVKVLIDEGANVDAVDDSGWTALMHANEAENVRVLLNAGANMAIKNNDGETALAMAIRYEQEDVVQLLKSRGAPE